MYIEMKCNNCCVAEYFLEFILSLKHSPGLKGNSGERQCNRRIGFDTNLRNNTPLPFSMTPYENVHLKINDQAGLDDSLVLLCPLRHVLSRLHAIKPQRLLDFDFACK